MVCERCGSEIEDSTSLCPSCGSALTSTPNAAHQHTSYGYYPQNEPGERVSSSQGYSPQAFMPPSQSYNSHSRQNNPHSLPGAQNMPRYYAPNAYQLPPANSQPGGTVFTNKNSSALIVEILLSLIGLFGIGWIVAGETTIGITLLLCSIFVYWPLMIFGTVFTLGIGLLCLGPLSIACIIVNALAINSLLNRKSARIVVPHSPQPPGRQMPSDPYQW